MKWVTCKACVNPATTVKRLPRVEGFRSDGRGISEILKGSMMPECGPPRPMPKPMPRENVSGRNMPEKSPTTLREWTDLMAQLVHVRLDPPKESHGINVFPVVGSKVNGPARTFAGYSSADVCLGVDALVTGVAYDPPKLSVKVGDEWKHERDVFFPHGRLSLTVDLFLDKPIVDLHGVAGGKGT